MSTVAAELRACTFLTSFEVEGLMLTLGIGGELYQVMLPEEYPHGEPMLFGDDVLTLRPGNAADVAAQVYEKHRKLHAAEPAMVREPSATAERLTDDIVRANARFGTVMGDPAAVCRSSESSDWLTLSLALGSVVDKQTASAWGATVAEPMCVKLRFGSKAYVDQNRPPEVEVSTRSGATFQLGQQLKQMLRLHLATCWATGRWAHPSQGAHAAQAEQPTVPRPALNDVQQHIYMQLLELGYDDEYSVHAAKQCDTLDTALDFDLDSYLAEHRPQPKPARSDDAEQRAQKTVASVGPSSGFAVYVLEYARLRLQTAHLFCVICDEAHVFQNAAMLKPSVCSRDLCVFAYHELSVGSDAAEMVATDAGVIDLLVNVFRTAAKSSRADKILDPYPHVVDPTNKSRTLFDPKAKDLKKIRDVLATFPSVTDVISTSSRGALKETMEKRHAAALPLLEWIISSNRSLLVKLDPAHQLPSMSTKHQFLLVTAPPERARKFAELKKKHGTKFAFHGSGMENWHAILRNGLRNCSNTDLMVNGAAHGSGIYFAKDAGTSIGYCREAQSSGAEASKRAGMHGLICDSHMICMALCEIVSDGIHDHGWCWTVADETRVMTRFFFVFDDEATKGRAGGANTTDDNFRREIEAALAHYNAK